MLPMVLLAGGKATRLGTLTADKAKSLVEIEGRPFIDYQLQSFYKNGFHSIIICVGKFADQIIDYVGDGSQYKLEIKYSYDGIEPKGTGGALKLALPLLKSDFFLQYGDSFLDINYSQMEAEYKKEYTPCLMSIYQNHGKLDKSNVRIKSGSGIHYSKSKPADDMDFIDYGCLVFDRNRFWQYQSNPIFDLSAYIEYLAKQNELKGFEVKNRFFEIGSLDGIREFADQVRSHPSVF